MTDALLTDVLLTRDAFLSTVGQLAEEIVHVAGLGRVLCRELTGNERATVLSVLAPAMQAGGHVDLKRYQQMLLEYGLVDPQSPEGSRLPLLDFGSAVKAMELGASKVEKICGTIERLSGLDKTAAQRAEGNSGGTPSSSSTSG